MVLQRACRALVLAVALLGGTLLALACAPGVAGAVVNPDYTKPAPTTLVTNPTPRAPQSSSTRPAADRPLRLRLPITGGDVAVLASVGAVVVGLGLAVRVGRNAMVRRS